jgi:transposase
MFDELSNDEWDKVAALVADPDERGHRRGRPRAQPRTIVNAVLWVLTTGETWSRLPSRYPTVPTCRRRFLDWQANGVLIEIVKVLAEGGRSFAYLPTPAVAEEPAPRPAPPTHDCDRLRGVFWQNPESWNGAELPAFRPLIDATRDLIDEPSREVPRRLPEARDVARAHAGVADRQRVAAPLSPPADGACTTVPGARGYTIYGIARAVSDGAYRGWAEIVREGRRVERSGLIGPRFDQADDARRYAVEWAQQWIASQVGETVPVTASESEMSDVKPMPTRAALPAGLVARIVRDGRCITPPPESEHVEPRFAHARG